MILVSVADERYALPLAVTLYSAVSHCSRPREVRLVVFDAGITDGSREKIARALEPFGCSLEWIEVSLSAFSDLPLMSHISAATYARLSIPDVIGADVEKVLYLDSDTVVEGDLAELWDTPLEGHALAAVRDSNAPRADAYWGIQGFEELGIPPTAPFFNSGVMLIDVIAWRARSVSSRVVEYVAANQRVRTSDQEGLNVVLWDDWLELDPKWNQLVIPHLLAFRGWERRERGVLHFATSSKPWTRFRWHPMFRVYDHFAKQLEWESWPRWTIHTASLHSTRLVSRTIINPLRRARRVWRNSRPAS